MFLRYKPVGLVLSLFLIAIPLVSSAQQEIGFLMPKESKSVKIPFEEFSNLIVIPVTINGFLTLKFVLDTGAESIILTEKVFGDVLGLNYVRTISIDGPGVEDSIKAYVASNVYLSLPGGIKAKGMHMLVLKEDYLELTKNLGEEIYGIIGYDLFSRFVVEVNYAEKMLTLYDPKYFKPRKNFVQLPMKIKTTKPYLDCIINHKGKTDTLSLMVDSGASHALLLDHNVTDSMIVNDLKIEASLGQGLGGDIPGYLSRLDHYTIGSQLFKDVLISIPKPGAYIDALKRGSRHGTVGGDLLSRLHIILDYPHQLLYIEKYMRSNESFEYDMSGLKLTAMGLDFDSIYVEDVRKESPAFHVGIKPGDYVYRINGLNSYTMTISDITAMLRKKDHFKIKMTVIRNDEKIKVDFRLKKII